MKSVDYLIIGGSAAGTTAAEIIRNKKPEASILIVTDENHEQYSRVLIPHYIRNKVDREQVFLKKPDWYREKNIELVKSDKANKLVYQDRIVSFDSGEQIKFKKLLIAVGGKVIPFKAENSELANILYMRTIGDADRIIEASKSSKSGVVIGGGFIGLEFSSCFKANGVENVTVLVREPYFWQGKLDEDSSKVLVDVLNRNGVDVLTNEEVSRFEGNGKVEKVVTKTGKSFEAQVVGIGVGIKSDLSWLESSEIEIGRAVLTNEFLETNLPDVYAAGDCAEFKDVIFGRQHVIGNWANATSQGRVVGMNMASSWGPADSSSHSTSSTKSNSIDDQSSHVSLRSLNGTPSAVATPRTVFETASSYSITFYDGSCSFIGVTEEDFSDEVISRGSVETGKMTRIFVKTIDGEMRVVGATIINNQSEVAPLTSAVKGKIDVSGFEDRLGDKDFNLSELLVS